MIRDILNTIASLIEENAEVFAGESEKQLVQKVKVDLESFKPINFYALDAEKQIADLLLLMKAITLK